MELIDIFIHKFNKLNERRYHPDEDFFREMKELADRCLEKEFILLYIKVVTNIGLAYSVTNRLDKANEYYNTVLKIAQDYKLENLNGATNAALGTFHRNFAEYEKAIEYFKKALDEFILLGEDKNIINMQQYIGICYYKLNDYTSSFDYLQQAYYNLDKVEIKRVKGNICAKFGILHNEIGMTEQAYNLLMNSNKLYKECNHKHGIAHNQNVLGLINLDLGKPDLAQNCFLEAEKLARELNDYSLLADSLNNLGLMARFIKDTHTSIGFFIQSIDIRKNCGPMDKLIETISSLVKSYVDLNEPREIYPYLEILRKLVADVSSTKNQYIYHKALAYYHILNKDTEQAKENSLICLKLSEQLNNQMYEEDAFLIISKYYKSVKDFENSLEFLEKYFNLKNNSSNQSKQKRAQSLHVKYEITNLKYEFESQIKQERVNAALAMAVTANHEINQPLMIIQGNLEMLIESIKEDNITVKQEKYITKINDGLHRICDLLDKFKTQTEINFVDYTKDHEMVEF